MLAKNAIYVENYRVSDFSTYRTKPLTKTPQAVKVLVVLIVLNVMQRVFKRTSNACTPNNKVTPRQPA